MALDFIFTAFFTFQFLPKLEQSCRYRIAQYLDYVNFFPSGLLAVPFIFCFISGINTMFLSFWNQSLGQIPSLARHDSRVLEWRVILGYFYLTEKPISYLLHELFLSFGTSTESWLTHCIVFSSLWLQAGAEDMLNTWVLPLHVRYRHNFCKNIKQLEIRWEIFWVSHSF